MRSKGRQGEDLACQYLKREGYKLLERNYRFGRGEIDIIAEGEGLICFIEVKWRSNTKFGEPETFVSQNQKDAILMVADHYTHENDWEGGIRFDIVAIKEVNASLELEHFQDAFY